MTLYNVLSHDFRNGLMRKKYFIATVIALVNFFDFIYSDYRLGLNGSFLDVILHLFNGCAPIISGERGRLPLLWLLALSLSLILGMDYPLKDLTENGMQILIRCNNRKLWFFSKCIWNIFHCLTYFIILVGTSFVLSVLFNVDISFTASENWLPFLFPNESSIHFTVTQGILVGILMPWLTIAAVNLLQMNLCLLFRPIVGFVICLSILVLSVFSTSPILLGNGAMTVRLVNTDVRTLIFLSDIFTAFGSTLLGFVYFSRMDILAGDD